VNEHVELLIGTKKGAFILESDAQRESWHVRGPYFESWPIHHVVRAADGTLYAGGGSAWYGATVFRSEDDGETWTQSSSGMTYGDNDDKITTVWHVSPSADGRTVYAGVEPAGLFRSDDRGETWTHVAGLRDQPSRPEWQPGNGGLILHSIAQDPTDADHIWVGISSVGTFETTDGGKSWETRNKGVRADFYPGPPPEFGQCVHKLLIDPTNPERLIQQNHCGVYRTDDSGSTWTEITNNLPSDFGFPMAVHPREAETLWVIPHTGPGDGRHMIDGHAAVWRSRDRGDTWQQLDAGLPAQNAYLTVLREAMATDRLEPAGVYFGSSTGQVFASADEGDSWRLVADLLPDIWSVEAATVES